MDMYIDNFINARGKIQSLKQKNTRQNIHLLINLVPNGDVKADRKGASQTESPVSLQILCPVGQKKQDLGTNLNTDGVIILWPFHCAIKINFFQ